MTTDAFDARDVFATKADLFATKAELKEEIGALRAEMHQMEARLTRWMVGTILAGMVAAATLASLIG